MKNITLVLVVVILTGMLAGCKQGPTAPTPEPTQVACASCSQATQTPTASTPDVPTATATNVVNQPTATSTNVVVNTATATQTSTEVAVNPTATATATSTPVLRYCYLKVTADTPNTACSFQISIWTRVLGVNTYIFGSSTAGGTAVIDGSNPEPWVWTSVLSDGYPHNGASFNFYSPAAPSSVGLNEEVHEIENGVDTILYSNHVPANQPSGVCASF